MNVENRLLHTETVLANIAAITAILAQGLVESVTPMNNELFSRVKGYRSAMAQAVQMLESRLISNDEYTIIDTMMADKYGLFSCSIFRDINLLYKETGGNIVTKLN